MKFTDAVVGKPFDAIRDFFAAVILYLVQRVITGFLQVVAVTKAALPFGHLGLTAHRRQGCCFLGQSERHLSYKKGL
jgi:hypothetical protein